jgi:hypothetical protein
VNKYTIIPSSFEYQLAPKVDQDITVNLEESSQQIIEYDRASTVSLAQVFEDERQACTIFRPTFKVVYLYANTITGTTRYTPFQYNLYYVDPETSSFDGVWKGFPQYYEFDFFRRDAQDQHFDYKSKSAYTYNWMYYLSYAYNNDYNKQLYYNFENSSLTWTASTGIPFVIKNSSENGNTIISFQCIAPHGLTSGEYVELSFSYANKNLFQVYSLGNGLFDSDKYIFNIYNVGYTGTTFSNNVIGTFKRVTNLDNPIETTSKYYVRQHMIHSNPGDIAITRTGFEKNLFSEQQKFEYSSITPNKISRVSKKTASNAYNLTLNYDLDLSGTVDNQKRPVSELFLTVINKGYSGYFNKPNNGVGLKQGWEFNITQSASTWWDSNNQKSDTTIPVESYDKTDNGIKYTFYYNSNLKKGDIIDGDFCEWNDYEQTERVISPYYQKLKFNENIFQTVNTSQQNPPGYYYKPHNSMTIRIFSDYIETGDVVTVDLIPSYSFYSAFDQQFRWRDLYSYGFIDNLGRGVDYPFFNSAQYPYQDIIFRLIPEGSNYNETLLGINIPLKPLVDGCE